MKKLIFLISCLIFSVTFATCGKGGQTPTGTGGGSPGPTVNISLGGESDTPVAEINGTPITEKELSTAIGDRLTRIKSQIFDIQRQGINAIINDRLLEAAAKKDGVNVQEFLKKNVNDKVGDVTDQEVQDFYDKNKARFKDRTLDQVKENVKRQLQAQKAMVFRNNLVDRLREDAEIKVFITRPTINVSVDDDASRGGNKDAKVTIIEFTDYQCPFCGRARPTVNQIIETYGDKVHYVLRDFPLNFHPYAQKAAEAAECAGEEDKYWEYSQKLWDNQKALDVSSLKKYASELKLNSEKFDQCLESGKMADEVNKDMTDGSKAGVSGTPSFFINGQMLTGARPFEQFKEVIDLELATGGPKS
jgi:protein-disulfide isomerase